MGMRLDDAERYLRLMLGGMKYAVRYWEDRDKEESDIEQTNVEAVKIALDTIRKYQKIEQILDDCNLEAWELEKKIREVVEDGINEKTSD